MEKIIIYQVLPRLFGNTKEKPKCNGSLTQNGCGKLNDFTTDRLKEIKDLGITHIWYTGVIEHATQTDYSQYGIAKDHPEVVKGKAGSPYAIKDYYDIDPDLAVNVPDRMKEFQELVSRTHKTGMKVIIDFVPNHVARQYHSDAKPKNVKDLGEDDNTNVFFSNQNNFYYLPGESFSPQFDTSAFINNPYIESPCKATGNDCFSSHPNMYDWYETVKLNYGVDYWDNRKLVVSPIPNTWIKMRDILLFWCKKKIDGFRCDMAEMVPISFWSWVIPQIKEKYPNIVFIAETYDPNQYHTYLHEGKFDYLYDKVGFYDTLRSIMRNENACHNITSCWQRLNGIEGNMLNFLENHDEQRIAHPNFAGNADKGKAAMIVAATINKGPIMIYNGQEFGEKAMDHEGFSGEDGRTSIFDYWTIPTVYRWLKGKSKKEEKDLRDFYKRLLCICREETALSNGQFFDLEYANFNNPNFNTNKQFAFLRKNSDALFLIVTNFEDSDVNIGLNIPSHAFEYLGLSDGEFKEYTELLSGKKNKGILSSANQFEICVPKNEGVIVKFKL